MATVAGLFVYPFKSARGIAMSSVRLAVTGFEWDRNWMAIDKNSKFITQRTHPKLATLVPKITGAELVLSAPGLHALAVPLQGDGARVNVRVWDDDCDGIDQGAQAATWLSGFLQDDVRIVRIVPTPRRIANPKYAGAAANPVSFADGFPILVCNSASFDDLNARMPEPVPMERFRPNMVVGGLPAFAEDRIDLLKVGDIELRLVKPCTRCIVTSTDQQTGQPGANPLPVLRAFRFDRSLLGVTFGENAIVSRAGGAPLELGREIVATFVP